MHSEPSSPVTVIGSAVASGMSHISSNDGGVIGEMSTPELLAKRFARQQAERAALAGLSARHNLARRLLQPVHNQQPIQQQQTHRLLGGANPLARIKHPLEPQKPAPAAAQQTGVSVDELAKLLGDDAGSGDSPAKRLKLTDFAPDTQQQQQRSQQADCQPIRCPLQACLLSCRQIGGSSSLAAAGQRLAKQRQRQQKAEAAQAEAQAVKAAEAAAQSAPQQVSATPCDVDDDPGPGVQSTTWMYRPAMQQQQHHLTDTQFKGQENACPASNRLQRESSSDQRAGQSKSKHTTNSAEAATAASPEPAQRVAKQSRNRQVVQKRSSGQQNDLRGKAPASKCSKQPAGNRAAAAAAGEQHEKGQQVVSADKLSGSLQARLRRGHTAAAVAAVDKLNHPLQQLAAVTVKAPSRRLQQVEAAAAAPAPWTKANSHAAPLLEQHKLFQPPRRACAPIRPVMEQQLQQHRSRQQQAHPGRKTIASAAEVQQQELHITRKPADNSQYHTTLPSPLARRIAAAVAAAAGDQDVDERKCAGNSGRMPTSAADAAVGSSAAVDGAPPAHVLLLDCSDDPDNLKPSEDDLITESADAPTRAPAVGSPPAAHAEPPDTWTAGGTANPQPQAPTQQESMQAAACCTHELLLEHDTLSSDRAFGSGVEGESAHADVGNDSEDVVAAHDVTMSSDGSDDQSADVDAAGSGNVSQGGALGSGASSSAWEEAGGEGMQLDDEQQPSSDAGHNSSSESKDQRGTHNSAKGRQRQGKVSRTSRTAAAAAAAAAATEDTCTRKRPQRACTRKQAAAVAAALADSADSGRESEAHSAEEDERIAPTKRRKAAATCTAIRKGKPRPGKLAAAAAAESELDRTAAGDVMFSSEEEEQEQQEAKPAKRGRAAGDAEPAAAADGVTAKSRKKAPTAAAEKKPRAKKTAHRQNFRRHTHNGGYGFKFVSKSASLGGKRRFRRITRSGKLIVGGVRAPHMAGQGAEFVDGFSGKGAGGGRCHRCGQAGHWQYECPLNAAAIAAQEAEMAEWRTAQAETEAEAAGPPAAPAPALEAGGFGKVVGGIDLPGDAGIMPTQAHAQLQPSLSATQPSTIGYHQGPEAGQQQKSALPPPLPHAELCAMAGLEPDAAWQPDKLTGEQLLGVLRGVWGHQAFRGQQLPLIQSALNGRSMLGVLPTGLGKSLTYQMPALLLQGLVVVVSPLLALMRDQLERLPKGLPGAMLQGSMTKQEVEQVLERAENGQLRLLYVAPEKLSARPVMACLTKLSPLPLVCVDEAHCMAEWGQGFRPAYFRLGHLLCNVLRPRAVLALTATATPVTRCCIRQLLNIPPEQQLIESPLRNNLRLQVVHCNGASKGGGIAARVVQMLTSGELSGAKSVVVYAGFKAAADHLAAQLQRAAVPARAYHAGMRQQQREAVQTAFVSGALRVVVATVAFGMGVDKQDLDAVVHTCMPHSLEEYVQQVGRAGRDGRTGHCTLFLDDADFVKLRALAHAGTARRESIEVFMAKVFGRDCDYEDEAAALAGKKHKWSYKLAPSRHRVLPLRAAAAELDLAEEVMEGCLSFLQADPVEPYLTALPNVQAALDVRFHRSTPEQLAEKHPVIDAILKAKCRKYAGTYKVHMPALVSVADRPPGELVAELAALAAARELGMDMSTEGALAWRLERQPQDWQGLVRDMATRLEQVMRASVSRLDRCYAGLAGAAVYSSQAAQERHLRAVIDEYFMDQQDLDQPAAAEAAAGPIKSSSSASNADKLSAEMSGGLMADSMEAGEMPWGGVCPIQQPSKDSLARQMRASLKCAAGRAHDLGRGKFTGLALARLLAGLASPAVPASVWKGCSEWGRLAAVDFKLLVQVGNEVVEEFWNQHEHTPANMAGLKRCTK